MAIISPWIRELGVKKRISKYLYCHNCCTGFFTKRYTSAEMSKIYLDYRGLKYVNSRKKWEPWYSDSYNANHDAENWVQSRKSALSKFLLSQGISSCNIVVDIGGNRGEFIPDLGKQKFLLDISEKKPFKDVIKIRDFDELPTADLVIYAHVLEHVARPVEELEKLFQKTSKIYVEVPYGMPIINSRRRSKLRFLIHLMTSLTPSLWRQSAEPAAGRSVAPNKMLSQSEHLTFFSEKSMGAIAELLKATVTLTKTTISTPDSKSALVLQCLFTRVTAN